MRQSRYWSLEMEHEEGLEPLFLERKHVKFIVLWGAAVTCVLGAIILERFFL